MCLLIFRVPSVFLTRPPPSLSRGWLGFVKNGSPAPCPAELQVPQCPVVMSSLLWVICAALPCHLRCSPANWTLETCAHPVLHSQAQCRFPDLVRAWKVDWEFTRTQRHRKKKTPGSCHAPSFLPTPVSTGSFYLCCSQQAGSLFVWEHMGQRWKEEKVQN